MDITLTQGQSTGIGIIVAALAVLFITLWWYADRRTVAREDAYLTDQWASYLAAVPVPPGQLDVREPGTEIWDWPAGHLAEYFFPEQNQAPVHPQARGFGHPSGPFAVLDAEDDVEDFIRAMRRRTDAYITELSRPLPIMAG